MRLLAATYLIIAKASPLAQLTDAEPDASKVVVKVDDTISVVSNRTKRGDVSIVALDLVEGKRDDMWGQTPAVISP